MSQKPNYEVTRPVLSPLHFSQDKLQIETEKINNEHEMKSAVEHANNPNDKQSNDKGIDVPGRHIEADLNSEKATSKAFVPCQCLYPL